MGALIATNWPGLILALLIGLATAWWIWGEIDEGDDEADEAFDFDDLECAPSMTATFDTGDDDDQPPPDEDRAPGPPAGTPGIAPAVGAPDDLTVIRGVGPKLDELLKGLGITRFDQIAAWTQADIAEIDPHLDAFRGRIDRDDWIEQARLLAQGQTEEFEARFGGGN